MKQPYFKLHYVPYEVWLAMKYPKPQPKLKPVTSLDKARSRIIRDLRRQLEIDRNAYYRSSALRLGNTVSSLGTPNYALENQRTLGNLRATTNAAALSSFVYGLGTAPITTSIGTASSIGGSYAGRKTGDLLEEVINAPEYTSDVLGFVGGLGYGASGTRYALRNNRIQAAEIPFKARPFNFKPWGSKKFWNDVLTNPEGTLQARAAGLYPMTFSERRKLITDLKKDIDTGVKYAIDRGKTLSLTANAEAEATTLLTSTKLALKLHGSDKLNESGKLPYGAFKTDRWNVDGTRGPARLVFPLRSDPKSLIINNLTDKASRILTGAHEALHAVQDYMMRRLTDYKPYKKDAYNRYLSNVLDPHVKKAAAKIIRNARTKGTWEGSLSEMDAEMVGWMAENNFPYKFSQLTPDQKHFLAGKALERFGDEIFTDSDDFLTLFRLMSVRGY